MDNAEIQFVIETITKLAYSQHIIKYPDKPFVYCKHSDK